MIKIISALLSLVLLVGCFDAKATVTNTATSSSYSCDGVATGPFGITFPYLNQGDLAVTSTTAGGVVTSLALTTDYTLSVVSTTTTATITLVAGSRCPAGSTLKIKRNMGLTQPTNYRTQGAFLPQTLEQSLDRLEMQIQQVSAQTAGAGNACILGVPNTYNQTAWYTLRTVGQAGSGSAVGSDGLQSVGGASAAAGFVGGYGAQLTGGAGFSGASASSAGQHGALVTGGAGGGPSSGSGGGSIGGAGSKGIGGAGGAALTSGVGGSGGVGLYGVGGAGAVSVGSQGGSGAAGGQFIGGVGGTGTSTGAVGSGIFASTGATGSATPGPVAGVYGLSLIDGIAGGYFQGGPGVTCDTGATPNTRGCYSYIGQAVDPTAPSNGDTWVNTATVSTLRVKMGAAGGIGGASGVFALAPIRAGTINLVSGTPSTGSASLPGLPGAGATSWICVCSEVTNQANTVKCVNTSTLLTATGPNSVTDQIHYICMLEQ